MPVEFRATYRVQLRPEFGFADAAAILPYLSRLGISHLYVSPITRAAAGSTHGYDVVDPSSLNPELGGREGFAVLAGALREHRMGLLVDVVPNHMAIPGPENPWWWDVLKNGPTSRYAPYFDVDWDPPEARHANQVLLPVLGDHYGRVLDEGAIRIERHGGEFVFVYGEHSFPVDPGTIGDLLRAPAAESGSEVLAFLASASDRLPRVTAVERIQVARRHRDAEVIADLVRRTLDEDREAAAAVEAEIARVNGDPDVLDELLERQNYRLAFWRAAGRDLGYRRFFDVTTLIGVRVEDEEVFRASHALVARLVAEGVVDGLRVDHPDGLRDPAEYVRRLRAACPDALVVLEKILEPGEELPADWPVEGTTGYEFLNLCDGLFVDPAGAAPLDRLVTELTGETADFETIALDAKRQVLRDLLGSELARLTSLMIDACEEHRRHRDYTRPELAEALLEVAAAFPVYRTYQTPGAPTTDADRQAIEQAVGKAAAARPDLDPELFRFLSRLLLFGGRGPAIELAIRFQQLTGPAMAKGVEDTAFYRHLRCLALNEVGGAPGRFGTPVDEFHRTAAKAAAVRPRSLLAGSTHDTKRSEDVRARLLLMSWYPDRFAAAARRFLIADEPHRLGDRPEAATRYYFFQSLYGAWPISAERVQEAMRKSVREMRRHTSWTRPDEGYEQAVEAYVAGVLADRGLVRIVAGLADEFADAARVVSLAATLVRIAAPGIPDFYQGTEAEVFALVDPDNRRPVDYKSLRERLEAATQLTALAAWRRRGEGLAKLFLVHRALAVRAERPAAFAGSYEPLAAHGPGAERIVAFARGGEVAVIVPRLGDPREFDAGPAVELPRGRFTDRFTGARHHGRVAVAELFGGFPAALLVREEA